MDEKGYLLPSARKWLDLLSPALTSPAKSGSVPATATSAGIAGQIAFDASFVYVCIATDSWKRAALSTW